MSDAKKVLSIDMDYIMAPSIELYNDLASREDFKNGTLTDWEKLGKVTSLDRYLTYDSDALEFVNRIFMRNLARLPKENIFFGKEHDNILDFLCTEEKKDEIFEIYNVDHHHDIYYDEEQKHDVECFDFTTLANWVYYLGVNDKIYKYHWIKNENSNSAILNDKNELTFIHDFDTSREDALSVSFDYMFICRSQGYFPDRFKHHFDMLLASAEEIKGGKFIVWEKPYCNGKTRHIPK